jgi:hypothetical protein
MFQPVWDSEILAEAQRTQTGKLGWPENLSDSWRKAVESAFPEALVTVSKALVESCANNEKDRHVLAAAIQGEAELIVTSNLKHFPGEALNPWGVTACHPAEYLTTLFSINVGLVAVRVEEIARKRKRTPEEHLAFLGRSVPSFAAQMAKALGWTLPGRNA